MPLPIGPMRPDTAKVERQTSGGTSNAGDPLPGGTATPITGLPCMISPESMLGTRATLGAAAAGPNIDSLYILIADAIPAAGNAPGSTFTVGSIAYVVHANGRDAFPDIRNEDRITRADGTQFLVLGPPTRYTDVMPTIQCHLVFGKAWG